MKAHVYKKDREWFWECESCPAGWSHRRFATALADAIQHVQRHYIIGFRRTNG